MSTINNQMKCLVLVVIVVLFYIAYKGYNKYKNKDETKGNASAAESDKDKEITKKLDTSKPDVDYDKIQRIVDNIMRQQI